MHTLYDLTMLHCGVFFLPYDSSVSAVVELLFAPSNKELDYLSWLPRPLGWRLRGPRTSRRGMAI